MPTLAIILLSIFAVGVIVGFARLATQGDEDSEPDGRSRGVRLWRRAGGEPIYLTRRFATILTVLNMVVVLVCFWTSENRSCNRSVDTRAAIRLISGAGAEARSAEAEIAESKGDEDEATRNKVLVSRLRQATKEAHDLGCTGLLPDAK